jgi:hypothetical protein
VLLKVFGGNATVSSSSPDVPGDDPKRMLAGPRSHGNKQIPALDPTFIPPVGRSALTAAAAPKLLSPNELLRSVMSRMKAIESPAGEKEVTELLAFVLTRGQIADAEWSSVAELNKRAPKPKVTVFEQMVQSTSRKNALSGVPLVKGFIEEGHLISDDQLRCLINLYSGLSLKPKAQRKIESIFARVALGPAAELDKVRYAGAVLGLEKKRLGRAPLDSDAVEKAATMFHIGGLTVASRDHFGQLLEKYKLSPEAATRAESIKSEAAAGEHAEWTYYVHIEGRGTLKKYAVADVLDLESIGSIRGKVNIVALVTSSHDDLDTKNEWRGGTRIFHVRKNDGAKDRIISSEHAVDRESTLGELLYGPRTKALNPSDPALLRATIEYVKQTFPSKHLLVDLWGHGSRPGTPIAGEQGTIISARNLATALSELNIDVLSCNACTMGTYEAALAAEEAGVKFFAASQHTVPGVGVKYRPLFAKLDKALSSVEGLDPQAFSKLIVDHYVTGGPEHTAFTSVDLSKMVELRRAIMHFALAMSDAGGLTQNIWLRQCWDQTIRVQKGDDLDIGDLARRISERFDGRLHEKADELLAALRDSCYTRRSTVSADPDKEYAEEWAARNLDSVTTPTTGLALYGPRDKYDTEYEDRQTAWGRGPWIDLMKTLFNKLDPERHIPSWAVPPDIRRGLGG